MEGLGKPKRTIVLANPTKVFIKREFPISLLIVGNPQTLIPKP